MPDPVFRQGVEDADGQKRQAYHEKAGDSAAVERHPHGGGARLAGRLCGPGVRQHGNAHADVAGRERTKRADQETERGKFVSKNPKENEDDAGDRADGHHLALQVCLRAFFDCAGDLAHSFVAR
jgi:hypothetical protein